MPTLAFRRALAALLVTLLAAPPGHVAPSNGTIQGSVRMQGRPLAGVTVAFIELESGVVVRATSGQDGRYEAAAAPGEYAVTTESQAGLAVDRAPVKVAVTAGAVASADVELLAVPTAVLQEPPVGEPPASEPPPAETTLPLETQEAPAPVLAETTGTGAQIAFEPVTCFVAGEFPLLDAGIEPLQSIARARVYFRGAAGTSFYYVEMSQEAGRFFGKLPRPRVEASPIMYYLQSTTTEFEEAQTREVEAIVVEDESACGDRKVAAFGPPGAVTVFSAASGAAIAVPAGFAVGGAGLALGTAAIVTGAVVAGVGGSVIVTTPGGDVTPPPPVIIVPSPIPTPTPIPQPTPTPITTFR